MEILGQKRSRESRMVKRFKVRGIGDSRPKKKQRVRKWKQLETLGQKRTRESGMGKGFRIGGFGDSRPRRNQGVRNVKGI